MEENFKTYKDVLKYEFEFRHHKNPSYSLTAFARDLELSSSRLSEIFSGKQGLSPTRAKIIGAKIGYKAEKLDWFCNLVEAETARSPKVKALAKKRLEFANNGVFSEALQTDLPITLKWYHFVIRRMTFMKDFNSKADWISKKINVPIKQVETAIKDLLDTGLIVKDETGRLVTQKNIHFPSQLLNDKVAGRIARIILFKAFKARKIPVDRRHHGFHFFTIDKEQLPELKDLIKEFEDKVDNLTYKAKKHDEIMSLVVATFPLSE